MFDASKAAELFESLLVGFAAAIPIGLILCLALLGLVAILGGKNDR